MMKMIKVITTNSGEKNANKSGRCIYMYLYIHGCMYTDESDWTA